MVVYLLYYELVRLRPIKCIIRLYHAAFSNYIVIYVNMYTCYTCHIYLFVQKYQHKAATTGTCSTSMRGSWTPMACWPQRDSETNARPFHGSPTWMFPKTVVPWNHPFFYRVFHYKQSILGYHCFWKHLHLRGKFAVCQNLGIQYIQSPDPFLALILKSYCLYQDISWHRVLPESSNPPWFCIQCQQASKTLKQVNSTNLNTVPSCKPTKQHGNKKSPCSTNKRILTLSMFHSHLVLPAYICVYMICYMFDVFVALLHHNFTTKSNGSNRIKSCDPTHRLTVLFLWELIQKTDICVLKIDHNHRFAKQLFSKYINNRILPTSTLMLFDLSWVLPRLPDHP